MHKRVYILKVNIRFYLKMSCILRQCYHCVPIFGPGPEWPTTSHHRDTLPKVVLLVHCDHLTDSCIRPTHVVVLERCVARTLMRLLEPRLQRSG